MKMDEIFSFALAVRTPITLIAFLIATAAFVFVKAHGTQQRFDGLTSVQTYRLAKEDSRRRRLLYILMFTLLALALCLVIRFLRQ